MNNNLSVKYFTSLIIMFLFCFNSFTSIKAQSVMGKISNIIFYGNNKNPLKAGGEYIIFQRNNNIITGLVYVQNSDIFSCFKGTYNQSNNSLQKLTFTYPDMETGKWIKTKSNEDIVLSDFPYQLNYNKISQSANVLFNNCLQI